MHLIPRLSRATTRASTRLALTGLLLCSGISCEIKSYVFFTPVPADQPAILDITPPTFVNISPAYTIVGPFKISSFSFDVIDPTGANGKTPSGVNASTVRATFGATALPLTSVGNRYTASLAGVPDGPFTTTLSATDNAGNVGTSTWNSFLDRTAPVIDFTATPPATASSSAQSVTLTLGGTAADANIASVIVNILDVPSGSLCGATDNTLFTKGTSGRSVSENTFDVTSSVRANGTWSISYTAYNPVPTVGLRTDVDYCKGVTALDGAKDANGLPSPNVSKRYFVSRYSWTPAPVTTGSVIGRVTSGGPVVGATLTAGGRTATTGADGSYRIDQVTTGAQTVAVSNLPTGVTCTPSSKPVTVAINTDAIIDFLCSGFSLTYTMGTWVHDMPGVSSLACQGIATVPVQANAGYSAVLMGPPGGVQGTGQYNGTTGSTGSTILKGRIVLFGTYFWQITITGGGNFTSPSTTVTPAAGTCTSP